MPTAYSRVTLVSGARRVDLALPTVLPVADLMPQLLRLCAPAEDSLTPAAWSIARVGGPAINPARTLVDSGVVDGDVLELRSTAAAPRPAYVEDVRDAVEDFVDAAGHVWEPRTTETFALLAAAIGLAALTAVPQARAAQDGNALAGAFLLAALCAGAGRWADQRGHRIAAPLMFATGTLWGALAGWLTAGFGPWLPSTDVAIALLGGLTVACLARAVSPHATAHLAFWLLLDVSGVVVAACGLAGQDPVTGVRLLVVLAVLTVGVMPRLSLTVGGLAGADFRVRHFGAVSADEIGERFRQSRDLFYGGLFAAAVTAAVCGALLARGTTWDRWLGVAAGFALILRSRAFSRVPSILPLRLAGLVVLVVQALGYVLGTPALRPHLLLLGAVATMIVLAVSAVPLSEVTGARVKQSLNRLEQLVVVTMLVLMAGAIGVYDWVGRLAG
ncbi:type VII secretion integral membrane protein EccD [Actinoplanes cyaneus]|uniref:Type VII secretion integral membrane protein EccD n=1 Tax=Actinoplanes cyaneus TaxID=52696 RepID=A0A919IGV9_9ACTN|nr:type VII secretion integral membrane protein EccD [Actinoplanes cyaneus]MCW2142460.1 type VII secretion integral membrane protein EccD [Actinoplanes cyaneus]GID65268.1 type VII secretion integral membrane protein EccD [Actinoplanes cyaneus]